MTEKTSKETASHSCRYNWAEIPLAVYTAACIPHPRRHRSLVVSMSGCQRLQSPHLTINITAQKILYHIYI